MDWSTIRSCTICIKCAQTVMTAMGRGLSTNGEATLPGIGRSTASNFIVLLFRARCRFWMPMCGVFSQRVLAFDADLAQVQK